MRRFLPPVLLLVAAACGGSTPTGVNPPPGASGPASIVVQGGDGQQAEPGAAVATKPAVMVKDSAGQPVSGVTVTFAVDSGGGSLSATSAVTGTNGIATAGTWTLGTTEGRNTIRVTVGSLAPVKIAATAVIVGASFPTTTIGTGGGSINVIQPGPLNGFSLTVPGGAFTASVTATVSYASNTTLPPSSTITPISPLITVSTTTTAYATTPLTIHIPATIPAGMFPAIVIFDPATGTKELLTTIKWDATGVTALTRTLSGASILGTASLRASTGSSLMSPGAIAYVGGFPTAVLMADYDAGYRPGIDDWEFPTAQTELSASGNFVNTVGVAATSLWYYSNAGVSRQQLNGRFALEPGVPLSNRLGVRWTGVIGARFDPDALNAVKAAVDDELLANSLADADQNQFLTIRAKFATGAENGGRPRPQFIEVLTAAPDNSPFYFIVYRASGIRLYIADPSFPGDASRFLEFPTGAVMTPYSTMLQFLNNASSTLPFQLVRPTALGLSTLFPLDQFPATYAKVLDGSIGQGQFPTYETHSWAGRLFDTLYVVDTLRIWNECAGCAFGYTTNLSPPPSNKVAGGMFVTFNPTQVVGALSRNGFLFNVNPAVGTEIPFGVIVGSAPSTQLLSTNASVWLDWHKYVVRRLQTSITPATPTGYTGIPLALTHTVTTALLPPSVTYRWDFGDNTAKVSVANNVNVTHPYAAVGTYPVTAEILDNRNNQVIARSTDVATITVPQYAWQFTSATLTGRQLPPGGIGTEASDTTILNFFTGWVNDLQTNPGNWLFYLVNRNGCLSLLVEQFAAGQFAPVYDPTLVIGFFGSNCTQEPNPDFVWSLTFGTLGSGTLVGSAVDIPKPESLTLPGGSINAAMSGTRLSGTFTWRVRYSTGEAVYTFNFQGTQVLPKP